MNASLDESAPPAGRPIDRDADLRGAVLRIGASLDLDAVLREAVESVRALTGAAYGVIATIDPGGEPRDFVTSGFTPGQAGAMEAWPDALALFARLRELAAPLRLADLDAWVRSLGLSPFPIPCGAFQATPMRHRGAAAGGATSHESLMRQVWGEGRGNPQAVRSAVRKLRRKLGDDARNPKYILGERGLGYRMPAPDDR